MRFNAGDKVRLKSGGPPMTVEWRHRDTGKLMCVWFDGTKTASRVFDDASLELVQDDVPPDPPDHID